MNPDPGSGQAIWDRDFFALISTLNLRLEKRSTVPFCALNNKTRLFHFQLGGTPRRKISEAVAPRDTRVGFGQPRTGPSVFLVVLLEVFFPESLFSLCDSRSSFNARVDLVLVLFRGRGL